MITLEPDALTQTFPVYAEARRAELVQECDADPLMVTALYPDYSLLVEWSREVERAAYSGQRLPDVVLDSYRTENGDVSCAVAFRGRATQEGWPGYATLNEQAQRNLFSALALRRTSGQQP